MADDEGSSYVRLHITPLDKSLLTAIVPPSILPRARHISFHEIQTFPERPFGYVELPAMDAEKIKKRVQGSILKGTKVKIETARPREEPAGKDNETPKQKKDKPKKRKRDDNSAVEIGDRQVKRGWTVPAAKIEKNKEKQAMVKSKYSSRPECLFKTVLPENAQTSSQTAKITKTGGKKGNQAVVHEFAKTTRYATFLRSNSTGGRNKAVAEYVEGKGWVDEDGNVVETVTHTSKRSGKSMEEKPKEVDAEAMDISEQRSSQETSSDKEQEPKISKASSSGKKQQELAADLSDNSSESPESSSSSSSDDDSLDETAAVLESTKSREEELEESSSETSSSEIDSEGISEDEEEEEKGKAILHASPSSNSSSSDSDSSSASESDSDSEEEQSPKAKTRPQTLSGPSALSIKIPSVQSSEVHPLEALYKRRKSDATNQSADAVPETFSFFGADANDQEEDSLLQVPLTPFTQRDFDCRGLRSAAPTPDTSHANKRFVWPVEGADDEDWDEDAVPSSPTRKEGKEKTDVKGSGEETEFQKWFYEHRGEANRAWKKRRKVVAKEKRQRENRKRGERL